MNVRTLIVLAMLAAFAPASAVAKITPTSGSTTKAGKTVKKSHHQVTPRILCICYPDFPVAATAQQSQEEFEAQYDADMVAHGLPPVYGTTTADATSAG